ncbi:MAG: glycosyltransferase [candidate division WOR-3 bacterium]
MPLVCLLTSSHPVEYSRFLYREALSLTRNGYRVTLVGLGRERVEQVQGVKVVAIPERRFLQKHLVLRKVAQVALQELVDVYHCLDPWTLAIGLNIKKRRPGIRVIYESSEWFPQAFLDRDDLIYPLRWAGYQAIRRLEARAAKEADGVIETNQTRAQRFVALGVEPVLVPNYPQLEMLPEPSMERKPWLVYTGLISKHRGFEKLLQALALVAAQRPDVRLKTIGHFDPRDTIEWRSREFIRQTGITANIEFTGWLSYDRMFASLTPCLAGVVLLQPERGNDRTGLPNKLFEFMGSGLAVIASNFPEMASVVNETKCGWLVDPTSPEQIAHAMFEVLNDPKEAIRRGLAGRQAVLDRFNWTRAEARLLELYRRLLP